MVEMKNIGIISNNENKEAIETAKKIYDYLIKKEKGFNILLLDKDKMPEKYRLPSVSEEEFSKSADIIITAGGDGTFLRASKYSFKKSIPILGINAGNLGFLTVVDTSNMYDAIDRILKNSYEIEERMLLEGRFYKDEKLIESPEILELALNEFAIARSMLGKIIKFQIVVNEILIKEFAADGLIIATPTGSTAYSLSAGGPIVEPKTEIIIITPICPHTLLNRSIIISPDNKIEIIINSRNDKDVVSVDGKTTTINMQSNCVFRVKKSNLKLKFITFSKDTFFKVFREKFIERI